MSAEVIKDQVVSTGHGKFNARLFRGDDGAVGVALWQGDIERTNPLLCRVHSSCFTSESLGALDCDCAGQLDHALHAISASRCGILFYLLQEGRGAGLLSKARDRMVVQTSQGKVDTFGAYKQLGIDPDPRRYELVAAMCSGLGVQSVLQLMTNNPSKISGLEEAGLAVEAVQLNLPPSPYNSEYLIAKARYGHDFEMPTVDMAAPPHGMRIGDPEIDRLGVFHRIASYDLPVDVAGQPVWFRATAYSDACGGSERLILSYYRDMKATPILKLFRDRLFERLAGDGPMLQHFRTGLRRIVTHGAGNILAIPDDPAWLDSTPRPTEPEDLELLRGHAVALRRAHRRRFPGLPDLQ